MISLFNGLIGSSPAGSRNPIDQASHDINKVIKYSTQLLSRRLFEGAEKYSKAAIHGLEIMTRVGVNYWAIQPARSNLSGVKDLTSAFGLASNYQKGLIEKGKGNKRIAFWTGHSLLGLSKTTEALLYFGKDTLLLARVSKLTGRYGLKGLKDASAALGLVFLIIDIVLQLRSGKPGTTGHQFRRESYFDLMENSGRVALLAMGGTIFSKGDMSSSNLFLFLSFGVDSFGAYRFYNKKPESTLIEEEAAGAAVAAAPPPALAVVEEETVKEEVTNDNEQSKKKPLDDSEVDKYRSDRGYY